MTRKSPFTSFPFFHSLFTLSFNIIYFALLMVKYCSPEKCIHKYLLSVSWFYVLFFLHRFLFRIFFLFISFYTLVHHSICFSLYIYIFYCTQSVHSFFSFSRLLLISFSATEFLLQKSWNLQKQAPKTTVV